MSTRTFSSNLESASDANWIASKRIVNAFAPHEEQPPGKRVIVDPGHFMRGSEIVEVGAQSVIVPLLAGPPSAFRIDRICINLESGEAQLTAGAVNVFSPPAIPPGFGPVARVYVTANFPAIVNEVITDERSSGFASDTASIFKAHLKNDSQLLAQGDTGLILSDWVVDIGPADLFEAHRDGFRPKIPGYYFVSAIAAIEVQAIGKHQALARVHVQFTPDEGGDPEEELIGNAYVRNFWGGKVYAQPRIDGIHFFDGSNYIAIGVSFRSSDPPKYIVEAEKARFTAHRIK